MRLTTASSIALFAALSHNLLVLALPFPEASSPHYSADTSGRDTSAKPLQQAGSINERNNKPDNVGSIGDITYTTDLIPNPDGTFTGKFSAPAKSYENCSAIRSWATMTDKTGFCDGLKLYDQETKKSYHGDCISAFNAVADKCVFYFDKNPSTSIPYEFKFEFTGKVNKPPSGTPPSSGGNPPSGPSSGGSDPTPGAGVHAYYNEKTDAVEFSVVAYGYTNCTYLRSLAYKDDKTGFCNGLPLWKDGMNQGPSEICINSFNTVADKCIFAFDGGKKEYHFFVSVKASYFPEWAKKFPKKPTAYSPDPALATTTAALAPAASATAAAIDGAKASAAGSGLTAPVDDVDTSGMNLRAIFDNVSKTGQLIATATSFANCSAIRQTVTLPDGKGFCDGVPVYDQPTGRSLRAECFNGFNAAADRCVDAFNKGARSYAFEFTFSVAGVGANPPEAKKDGVTVTFSPVYTDKDSVGTVDVIAKAQVDCDYMAQFGSTRKGAFCEGLEKNVTLTNGCLNGYRDAVASCNAAFSSGKATHNFFIRFNAVTGAVLLVNPNAKPDAGPVPAAAPAKATANTPVGTSENSAIRIFERPVHKDGLGIFAADATSYDDCMRFERMSTNPGAGRDGFCGSGEEDCVKAFKEAGDACIKAFDEKKENFRFDVKVGGGKRDVGAAALGGVGKGEEVERFAAFGEGREERVKSVAKWPRR
ncbi:hypothetical protein HDU97_005275 [Phlyctochytrium planicorne]|nr:hypothetical protein HDU97_005275 [Phlyctochytrium planicorne]